MAVSYGLVIFKVRESHMRSSIRVIKGKKTLLASKKSIKDRKRVTTMCISLVVAFTFCWTMYHAIHLAKLFGVITASGNLRRFYKNISIFGIFFSYTKNIYKAMDISKRISSKINLCFFLL